MNVRSYILSWYVSYGMPILGTTEKIEIDNSLEIMGFNWLTQPLGPVSSPHHYVTELLSMY